MGIKEYVDLNTGKKSYEYDDGSPAPDPKQGTAMAGGKRQVQPPAPKPAPNAAPKPAAQAKSGSGDSTAGDSSAGNGGQEPSRFRRAANTVRTAANNVFLPETSSDGENFHRRNVARMGIMRGLDNMFGSGRSHQGDIGARGPLFQDEMADVQAAIDRENEARSLLRNEAAQTQALQESGEKRQLLQGEINRELRGLSAEQERGILDEDTMQQGRTKLAALIESGQAEQELQGIINREQKGLGINAEEEALLQAWREHRSEREREEAGQAREEAARDLRRRVLAQGEALTMEGGELQQSGLRNQQELTNALASLNQLTAAQWEKEDARALRLIRTQHDAKVRAQMAEALTLVRAYRMAQEEDPDSLETAQLRRLMNVGVVGQFAQGIVDYGENLVRRNRSRRRADRDLYP